jgi:hypothetical protein
VSTLNRLLRSLADALLRENGRRQSPPGPATTGRTSRRTSPGSPAPARPSDSSGYPGDFTGIPALRYDPQDDADADPGEVVWTWVPYEEDHSQGKDRPVLVIGNDGPWLLALPMTSKDHDRDARQEASAGRYWCDIGSGPWDREGRPSEVRVNRILRVDPVGIRRIAARLDHDRFEAVARQVLRHYR